MSAASGPPPSGEQEPAAAREAFWWAQVGLEEAAAQLREVLVRVEEAARTGRRHLEGGGLGVDVPVVVDVGALRLELADRMDALDRARMASRATNMVLAAMEGASASEIARRYKVSRQYVSKLLKEHLGR